MGNLKRRVERLERARKGTGFSILIIRPGETREEVWQRYLAAHPEREKSGVVMILDLSGQGSPGGPPPPRPDPKYGPQAPGPGPLQITR